MERLLYDNTQAMLLVFKLRMGVDVAIKHLDETSQALRHIVLQNFICHAIPVRRIWLYLKILKLLTRGKLETMRMMKDMTKWKPFDQGPEDVVVRSTSWVQHYVLSLS